MNLVYIPPFLPVSYRDEDFSVTDLKQYLHEDASQLQELFEKLQEELEGIKARLDAAGI